MINNTPDSKLDETVKKTLTDYEAGFDASDWARMESMLDAAPKSVSFKWSHVLTAVVGVVVIGGGIALYNVFKESGSKDEVIETSPVENTIKETPKTTTPLPSPKTNAVTTAPVVVDSVKTKTETSPVVAEPAKPENSIKITSKEEKPKEKKKTEPLKKPIIDNNDKVMDMGNEPIFGDMLDSSKGIIGDTKEKEETKKAAKAKKNNPVGWDQFMLPNVNADSLRKYREKRDSLKNK
jgi:hypothetical protein